jgi:hypothetical protein
MIYAGADPGFQVSGGALKKKLRRAKGGAKIFGVIRVKNHDFTPKNHIFSNFRGGAHPSGSAPDMTKKTYFSHFIYFFFIRYGIFHTREFRYLTSRRIKFTH